VQAQDEEAAAPERPLHQDTGVPRSVAVFMGLRLMGRMHVCVRTMVGSGVVMVMNRGISMVVPMFVLMAMFVAMLMRVLMCVFHFSMPMLMQMCVRMLMGMQMLMFVVSVHCELLLSGIVLSTVVLLFMTLRHRPGIVNNVVSLNILYHPRHTFYIKDRA